MSGQTENGSGRGATEIAQQDIKGKIVEFLWYMKKNGYSTETITTYLTAIKKLMES